MKAVNQQRNSMQTTSIRSKITISPKIIQSQQKTINIPLIEQNVPLTDKIPKLEIHHLSLPPDEKANLAKKLLQLIQNVEKFQFHRKIVQFITIMNSNDKNNNNEIKKTEFQLDMVISLQKAMKDTDEELFTSIPSSIIRNLIKFIEVEQAKKIINNSKNTFIKIESDDETLPNLFLNTMKYSYNLGEINNCIKINFLQPLLFIIGETYPAEGSENAKSLVNFGLFLFSLYYFVESFFSDICNTILQQSMIELNNKQIEKSFTKEIQNKTNEIILNRLKLIENTNISYFLVNQILFTKEIDTFNHLHYSLSIEKNISPISPAVEKIDVLKNLTDFILKNDKLIYSKNHKITDIDEKTITDLIKAKFTSNILFSLPSYLSRIFLLKDALKLLHENTNNENTKEIKFSNIKPTIQKFILLYIEFLKNFFNDSLSSKRIETLLGMPEEIKGGPFYLIMLLTFFEEHNLINKISQTILSVKNILLPKFNTLLNKESLTTNLPKDVIQGNISKLNSVNYQIIYIENIFSLFNNKYKSNFDILEVHSIYQDTMLTETLFRIIIVEFFYNIFHLGEIKLKKYHNYDFYLSMRGKISKYYRNKLEALLKFNPDEFDIKSKLYFLDDRQLIDMTISIFEEFKILTSSILNIIFERNEDESILNSKLKDSSNYLDSLFNEVIIADGDIEEKLKRADNFIKKILSAYCYFNVNPVLFIQISTLITKFVWVILASYYLIRGKSITSKNLKNFESNKFIYNKFTLKIVQIIETGEYTECGEIGARIFLERTINEIPKIHPSKIENSLNKILEFINKIFLPLFRNKKISEIEFASLDQKISFLIHNINENYLTHIKSQKSRAIFCHNLKNIVDNLFEKNQFKSILNYYFVLIHSEVNLDDIYKELKQIENSIYNIDKERNDYEDLTSQLNLLWGDYFLAKMEIEEANKHYEKSEDFASSLRQEAIESFNANNTQEIIPCKTALFHDVGFQKEIQISKNLIEKNTKTNDNHTYFSFNPTLQSEKISEKIENNTLFLPEQAFELEKNLCFVNDPNTPGTRLLFLTNTKQYNELSNKSKWILSEWSHKASLSGIGVASSSGNRLKKTSKGDFYFRLNRTDRVILLQPRKDAKFPHLTLIPIELAIGHDFRRYNNVTQ